MTYVHVEDESTAASLAEALAAADRIALDCEAAGFHRYENRLSLLQATVGERTFVVDPLAVDAGVLFRGVLEDPAVPVVMHGADFDLRLLRAELGIGLRGLFDTQIAASLLGIEGLGLAALLERRFGIELSKKYQRADWARRPLEPEMLEYAANDTRHLFDLADQLRAELVAAGRLEWVEQECRALEDAAGAPEEASEPEDPVVRVKGARELSTRQVAALREALAWRDEIARRSDRAVFRVVGDQPLVEAVARGPRSVDELTAVKGFPGRLAREHGRALLERLREVATADEGALTPYPRGARRGPGRPPPEVEELANRLKDVRNRRADELGLPRGTLLSNSALTQIALEAPPDMDALGRIEAMRPWRLDILGQEVLEVLRRG